MQKNGTFKKYQPLDKFIFRLLVASFADIWQDNLKFVKSTEKEIVNFADLL